MWRFARVILGMTLRKGAQPGWKEWLADSFMAFWAIYSHRPPIKFRSMKHCDLMSCHVRLERWRYAGMDIVGFILQGVTTIMGICGHSGRQHPKNILEAYCR